ERSRRNGKKRAIIATARKLAMLLHRASAAPSGRRFSRPVLAPDSSPRPGSCENDAHLPASAGKSARLTCPHPLPASAAPLGDSSPAPDLRSVGCIRGCVHLATRLPPATAPVQFVTLDSTLPPSPDSYSAHCSRAA